MYQLLPRAYIRISLAFYAVLAVVTGSAVRDWNLSLSVWQVGSAIAFVVVTILVGLLGISARWSPWRWVWRKVPLLNSLLYPDLNGVWVGTTHSNWSRIKEVRDAASHGRKKIELDTLDKIELLRGGVAMHIEENFFEIKLISRLSNTESNSSAVAVSVEKDRHSKEFHLRYIYEQTTKIVAATDEGSHLGAASLKFFHDCFDRCEGTYWTARTWQQASNTAGRICLRKLSDSFDPKKHGLLVLAENEVKGK